MRNERSGSTHLLAPFAGRVLMVLLERQRFLSVEEIAAALRGELTREDEPNVEAAIEAVLSDFARIGLAEPEQG